MIKFEVNGEFLVLKDATSINFILENPFFDVNYVVTSPYAFNFTVPDDVNGVNARLLQNTNRITKRKLTPEINLWVYLDNNKWIYGNIKSRYSKGEFDCYFNQLSDLIEQLEVSLTETPTGVIYAETDLYDEIRARADSDYAGEKDFIHYPVYHPDHLGDIGYITGRPAPAFDNMFYNQYGKYVNYWFSEKFMTGAPGDGNVDEYYLVLDKAAAYQGWKFDYTMSPALYVPWFMNKLFTDWGIKLNTEFFDDTEIQKLTIFSNKSFVMEVWSDQFAPSFSPVITFGTWSGPDLANFYLDNYLPDITRKQLLIGLKKTFCLVYLWDFEKASLRIITASEFINSNQYADWSAKTLKGYETIEPVYNGISLKTNYSDDAYLSDLLQQLTETNNLNVETPVNSFDDLPAASGAPGTICLVLDEQAYYVISGYGAGKEWVFLTQNYIDCIIDDGQTEISNDADTLLRLFNVLDQLRIDIYGDYDDWVVTTVYTTGARIWYNGKRYESLVEDNQGNTPSDLGENWIELVATEVFGLAKWTIPESSEENDSELNGASDKDENLRLLFYRGRMPYNEYTAGEAGNETYIPTYPYATHTDLSPSGSVIGNYSLSWNGANGLYEKHWKPYLDLMAASKPVNRKIQLTPHDLLSLDWRTKITINDPDAGGSVNYLVKKISVNISLKGIEPADVELCTI